MGLDMYLDARKSVYPSLSEADEKIGAKLHKMFPEIKTDKNAPMSVSFRVGYWRKANHIHKWFVDTVQDGKDNCGRYDVGRDELKTLLDLCKKALSKKDQAPNVLPTQEGFFFGSQEYDEGYFQDLELTVTIIEACLAMENGWIFSYSSSW